MGRQRLSVHVCFAQSQVSIVMMMKNEYCLYQRVSLFHPDAGNFCPHDFFEKRERKDVRDAPSVPGVAPLLINGTRTVQFAKGVDSTGTSMSSQHGFYFSVSQKAPLQYDRQPHEDKHTHLPAAPHCCRHGTPWPLLPPSKHLTNTPIKHTAMLRPPYKWATCVIKVNTDGEIIYLFRHMYLPWPRISISCLCSSTLSALRIACSLMLLRCGATQHDTKTQP